VRKFHAATSSLSEIPGRVPEHRLYECLTVDCGHPHVYELDHFEGQALNDLIDERRMRP